MRSRAPRIVALVSAMTAAPALAFGQDGRLRKEYIDTGTVKLVFRDFPLPVHPMAVPAAMGHLSEDH